LKWKVIVVFPFDNVAVFAGVAFTMKSLPCTVVGSAASLRLTVKSVGAVPTTMRPQVMLVAEQPVGVGPYLPPVFKMLVASLPPQTIISLPVQIAVCKYRAPGALLVLVAAHISVVGLYLPPVLK
jgi:hypothetical protein